MKIFIDGFQTEDILINKIVKRLKAINADLIIDTVDTLFGVEGVYDGDIAESLSRYEIIIPLITSDYLTEEHTNDTLEKISDDPNKYIIPIIYSPTNWSSKKWIVKNRIFPANNKSFIELNFENQEELLNEIIDTVESIIFEKKSKSKVFAPDKIVQKGFFISHSHDDSDFADLLKLKLEQEGVICWIDSEKLKVGQDWRQEIDKGILDSIGVVVIMTPEAKKSEYVTYEWAYAWGCNKKIFPIMLKQTNLHPRLESLQYLDFTNKATRPWEKLIEEIKNIQ